MRTPPAFKHRDLRATLAYLSERRLSSHRRLPRAVEELLALASREYGKDAGQRGQLTVTTHEGQPAVCEIEGGVAVLLEAHAVRNDHRVQAVYQAAHEVVHVACSEFDRATWVDEMLAVRFSLRVLGAIEPAYASNEVRELNREAELMSTKRMLAAELDLDVGYPDGLYGRAFTIGKQLEDQLGWPVVRQLARPGEPPGPADLSGWLAGLDVDSATAARAILGPEIDRRRRLVGRLRALL